MARDERDFTMLYLRTRAAIASRVTQPRAPASSSSPSPAPHPETSHTAGFHDAGFWGVGPEQLAEAEAAAAREGVGLVPQLVLLGHLSDVEAARRCAAAWGFRFADLDVAPPDGALLAEVGYEALSNRQWLPWRRSRAWRRSPSVVSIATSEMPTQRLREEAAAFFPGEEIEFVVVTPTARDRAYESGFRAELLYNATDRMAVEQPDESARRPLIRWQWWLPLVVLLAVAAGLMWRPVPTFITVFLGANLLFIVNIVFKTFAAARSPWRVFRRASLDADIALERLHRGLGPEWPAPIADEELPIYSILVPAFHEANIIGTLLRNLGRLDYPRSKLDVMLLLEEDDTETIAAARAMDPPSWVRIIEIPRGQPQTKPRACNYALPLCRGEFVVIFDAEDRPDADQLRRAVQAFRANEFTRRYLDPDAKPVYVVQAALNYFNADYNLLTRLFADEYSFWFDGMIPGLDDLGIPIPLGGTSNHFDLAALRAIGAWDPYNVTEDADLGIRVATRGGKVGVIDSTTWEEACAETGAWIRQRTRWIKGYMITAAVNARNPVRWTLRHGPAAAVSLFALILSTPLSFLSYPLIIAFTIVTYVGVTFGGLDVPKQIYQLGMLNMVIGNGLMIIASGLASWRRYGWRLAGYALLNPVYWLLHSVAAWRAAFQMYFSPHRWEKTPHGLTSEDFVSELVTTT